MKRLHPIFPLLALSTAISSAFAATEFGDTVPLEVVRQFVNNPFGGNGALYSDILDDFPPFTLPQDFTVLASADVGIQQRVILKTELDAAAADAAITAAFTAAGWTSLPDWQMNRPQTGFVSEAQAPATRHELCNDAYGSMWVGVSADAGPRYVNLNRDMSARMGNRQQSCSEMIEQRTLVNGSFGGSNVAQYAPRLVMPEPSQQSPMPLRFMSGSTGGSSDDWETENNLSSDQGIDAVYEHFATQVSEQDWTRDSEVTGSVSATGTWTRNIDNMNLVGILTVVEIADDVWNLKFRVFRQGGGGGGAGRASGSFTDRIVQ